MRRGSSRGHWVAIVVHTRIGVSYDLVHFLSSILAPHRYHSFYVLHSSHITFTHPLHPLIISDASLLLRQTPFHEHRLHKTPVQPIQHLPHKPQTSHQSTHTHSRRKGRRLAETHHSPHKHIQPQHPRPPPYLSKRRQKTPTHRTQHNPSAAPPSAIQHYQRSPPAFSPSAYLT